MTRVRLLVLVVLAALLTSGCGLTRGVYDTPLPGGADLGDHPITVKADFADVLELVPQSSVKVDNVAVGRVSKIRLNDGGRSARVTMLVNGSVRLPEGTTARVQQTSLLGEKYVSLIRPARTSGVATMRSGALVPLASTSQAVGVEQVLGALSLLLNGGGLDQFQDISRELQAVSTGRPEQVRDFLDQISTFVTTLDDRSSSITTALDGLDRLGRSLDADKAKLGHAIDALSPGMQVLIDQRAQLTKMLAALDRLSDVTVSTLQASQDDIVADLRLLEPILDQLAASGRDLPEALQIMLTYPFPDAVLGTIKGDYLNLFITTSLTTPGGTVRQSSTFPLATTGGGAGPATITAPPMILPSTSAAAPGSGATVSTSPSGSAGASGSPSGSTSPSGSPSTSSSPSPSGSTSPSQSTSPSESGSAGTSPSPSGAASNGGE